MTGFLYNIRRYFEMSVAEWQAFLITAVVMGFALSFRQWGGETFDWVVGLSNLVLALLGSASLLLLAIVAHKLVGIFYGIRVTYDKYTVGLLIGVMVTFVSMGWLPLFTPGYLRYESIPNLRVGKFRATLPKKWEIALIALAGPLAMILVSLPLQSLYLASGWAPLKTLLVISVLIMLYELLPLPVMQTPNVYTAYMSRMETLEGATPGFDIFFFDIAWYAFVAGFALIYAIFALVFGPHWIGILLATLLGGGTAWLYVWARDGVDPRPRALR